MTEYTTLPPGWVLRLTDDGSVVLSGPKRGQYSCVGDDEPNAAGQALYDLGRALAASAGDAGADATGRTPKDYVIEHAEYLAQAGESLLEAMNDVFEAEQVIEDFEGDEDENAVTAAATKLEHALERQGDAMSRVGGRVYEFRKRRDRAAAPSAPKVDADAHKEQEAALVKAQPLRGIRSQTRLDQGVEGVDSSAAAPQVGAAPADEREAFEVAFPKPDAVTWNGTEYVVREGWEHSYRCDGFVQQWRAWQARAALAAAPEVAAPDPTHGKPDNMPYLTDRLRDFTAFRWDNAGATPGMTLYFVKLGAHPEYQLYLDEAAALWINLGKALGPYAERAAQAACTGGAKA